MSAEPAASTHERVREGASAIVHAMGLTAGGARSRLACDSGGRAGPAPRCSVTTAAVNCKKCLHALDAAPDGVLMSEGEIASWAADYDGNRYGVRIRVRTEAGEIVEIFPSKAFLVRMAVACEEIEE